jgi:hypothetical protein
VLSANTGNPVWFQGQQSIHASDESRDFGEMKKALGWTRAYGNGILGEETKTGNGAKEGRVSPSNWEHMGCVS